MAENEKRIAYTLLIFHLLAVGFVAGWRLIVMPDTCKVTHKLPCTDSHLQI
jgi:hypothetical protein